MVRMGSSSNEIEIRINRQLFRVEHRPMTGAELRRISMPPIGPDQDLFQMSAQGVGGDVLVTDDQIVDFDSGVEFFSTPRMILAGRE
jgi:Multiubiquitin